MQGLDFSELVPRGFVVESAVKDDSGFTMAIRAATIICDARRAEGFVAACTATIRDGWLTFLLPVSG